VAIHWITTHSFVLRHQNSGNTLDYNTLVRSQALKQWQYIGLQHTRSHALKQWQLRLNSEIQNELHAIEPREDAIYLFRLLRQGEIIIHRLRIGYTYLTHGHLLLGETPPRCSACQVQLTVELILLHCVSFVDARDDFFCCALISLSDLFSKVTTRSINN